MQIHRSLETCEASQSEGFLCQEHCSNAQDDVPLLLFAKMFCSAISGIQEDILIAFMLVIAEIDILICCSL